MADGDKVKVVNNQMAIKVGGSFVGGAENVNWKRSTPAEDTTTLADTAPRNSPSPLDPLYTCDTDGFLVEGDAAQVALKAAQRAKEAVTVIYTEGPTTETVDMIITEMTSSGAKGKFGKFKLALTSDGVAVVA